jgi:sucrose-phosphate synthase
MAGNDWIGGYLDAILDSGAGTDDFRRKSSAIEEDKEALAAAKYFVNEVTEVDDTDLYHTWARVKSCPRSLIHANGVPKQI